MRGEDIYKGQRVRVNQKSDDVTKVGMAGTVEWVEGDGPHAGVWVELDGLGGRFKAAEELDEEAS